MGEVAFFYNRSHPGPGLSQAAEREEKEQGKSRAPMPALTPAVHRHLMPEPGSPTGVCLNSPLQNCRVTGALVLGTVLACTL